LKISLAINGTQGVGCLPSSSSEEGKQGCNISGLHTNEKEDVVIIAHLLANASSSGPLIVSQGIFSVDVAHHVMGGISLIAKEVRSL
jgi:hypothetical protein